MMPDKRTKQIKSEKGDSVVRKLALYMKPVWGLFFITSALALLGSLLGALCPNFMKNIVDEIQLGIQGDLNWTNMNKQILITVIIVALCFICNVIRSQISPYVSLRTAQRMRKDINHKANRIPLSYFDTNPEGETLSTMINDVDTLSSAFGNTLPTFMSAAATFVGCIVLMFVTNWILALTTIGATILGLVITAVLMAKGAPHFKKNQDSLAEINAIINEDLKGHLVVKAFGAEKETLEHFRERNQSLYDSTWKSQFISSMLAPISTFANNLGYIVVCVVGAIMALNGKIQIGTIIAFIQYAGLFAGPVSTFVQVGGQLQPAMAAGRRIFDMLEQEEVVDEGDKTVDASAVKGAVDFDHVRFGYVPDSVIVHDFSLRVKPGQKVAIVGPTGSGKSTLVNLLERFYELDGGSISIDGVPIHAMSRETLHGLISMVLQDTWTFEGTIRENIVYSKKNVTEEQLKKVCDEAGLSDFLANFPDGVDTILKEESSISAGQKQLITIARAMMDDSPILILDEATSSVDTRTESIISRALDHLMTGRTSFVIAHRLSTIKNADIILVLKDGDIIEIGSHEELMKKKGFYCDLYQSQFDHS
ncbi:MAG: ABC transporter ATP-binding protein [Blautia sp.]|nr:ABC transporter ATP-binding protein [Blautia sp.]